MKTYVCDWDGSCAIVHADDDDAFLDAIEPALADPTYPYSTARILEVPRGCVMDVTDGGQVVWATDAEEPRWFHLVWVRHGRTHRLARRYLPRMGEGKQPSEPSGDALETAFEAHDAVGLPTAEIRAALSKLLKSRIGYWIETCDEEPATTLLGLGSAIFSGAKDTEARTDSIIRSHFEQTCEKGLDGFLADLCRSRPIQMWEFLQELQHGTVHTDAKCAARVLPVLSEIRSRGWIKDLAVTSGKNTDGSHSISVDFASRYPLSRVLARCLDAHYTRFA